MNVYFILYRIRIKYHFKKSFIFRKKFYPTVFFAKRITTFTAINTIN